MEKDFQQPDALDGYILNEHSLNCLQRIAKGLEENSGHRAWRITGDYGTAGSGADGMRRSSGQFQCHGERDRLKLSVEEEWSRHSRRDSEYL
mgnify:CR=1 FL=1